MASRVNQALSKGGESSSNNASLSIDEGTPIAQLLKKRKDVVVVKDANIVEEPKHKRRRTKRSIIKIESSVGDYDKEINTNCKPHLFLMNGKEKVILTPAQIKDVKEIGFGGLLEISSGKIPDGIIPFLVANFDTDNRMQVISYGKSYFVTSDDVHDILGLPLNPSKPINAYSVSDDKLVKEWMTLLGVSKLSEFRATKISPLFEQYPDGGVIFKKLFAIYAVGIIIAPLPDFRLRKSLLRLVEDVDAINSFDWCTFVLDILTESISRVMKGTGFKNVNGCVLVLLAAYCYRFPFQGKRYSKSLPLIKHLTFEKLRLRFNQESKAGFGSGLVDLSGLPISHVYNDWCQGICVDAGAEPQEQRQQEPDFVSSEVLEQRCITYPLPSICQTDEDIRRIAKNVDLVSSDDEVADMETYGDPSSHKQTTDVRSSDLADKKLSEGSLIRRAKMYQEYMKKVSIPSQRGSIIPCNSWMELAKSIKELYGQPLHYLTNNLLKQWDQARFLTGEEFQPLDTVIDPLKAEATVWLIEEVHRLTASYHQLSKHWFADPMHRAYVDPIFPKLTF